MVSAAAVFFAMIVALPTTVEKRPVEYWKAFQEFEFANEVMLAVGALLLLIGVIKIIKSSITMLFWVLLSAVGLYSVSYAMDQKGIPWPGERPANLTELIEPGKEISSDVLQVLCQKLPVNDGTSTDQVDDN